MRFSNKLEKHNSVIVGFLLILLSIQTNTIRAAEAQTYSFFPRLKTAVYGFALAHAASMLSKRCALWMSHAVLGLEQHGLMYTAAMLDLKHVNNAIARGFFGQPIGSDNSFPQTFFRTVLSKQSVPDEVSLLQHLSTTLKKPITSEIAHNHLAENSVMPVLYKEYQNRHLKPEELKKLLTPNEQLSLEWYNTGTGFLTFWECFGLLNDAWNEISKKWDALEETQSRQKLANNQDNYHDLAENISLTSCPDLEKIEQKPSQFDRYMEAAYKDWNILTLGATFFAISYLGNMLGQRLGVKATELLESNGASLLERDILLFKYYAPFYKFVDTVTSYFVAQFIKYHVFNLIGVTPDQIEEHEFDSRFLDLMYRAADKGPFAWYFVLNLWKAYGMFRQTGVAAKAA